MAGIDSERVGGRAFLIEITFLPGLQQGSQATRRRAGFARRS